MNEHKCDLCPRTKKLKETEEVYAFLNYGPFKDWQLGVVNSRKFEVFQELATSKKKKMQIVYQLQDLNLCQSHAEDIEQRITGTNTTWYEGHESFVFENVKTVRRN